MNDIASVAFNGSKIVQSTKSGHVTYDVYTWQQVGPAPCTSYDPDTGTCTSWGSPPYDWVYSNSGSTGAKTNGTVSSSRNVYVNGKPIAASGDTTNETWVADPPVPSSSGSTDYRTTSATSGSGSGSVTSGNSSRVNVGGKSVAVIGSSVRTSVGNNTTIENGSSNVRVGG